METSLHAQLPEVSILLYSRIWMRMFESTSEEQQRDVIIMP